MKLPFPQRDGVSVLVDTYSDNDVPLAISQVEIIIRGSDVVIRTQDGSELTLVQAAQMSSMHENLFNLNFTDGTVISSNELFQRADLIEPGPELSEIKDYNVKAEANVDPLVAVVQASPVSETSNEDFGDYSFDNNGKHGESPRLSVSDFLGNASTVTDDTIVFVPSTTSGGAAPNHESSTNPSMPGIVIPTPPTGNTNNNNGNNGNNGNHGNNGGNNTGGGNGDNNGPAGLPFVEKANLYQVTTTHSVVQNDDGTTSDVWHVGGGPSEARYNPDLGVQYDQKVVLDLRGHAGEERGFVVHADNEAFRYGQVNTENSPNNLDRRLGRIVTFDQLVGGETVAGKTIKSVTDIPDGMTIIWKGSPDYADFVAKYGIELKDNEIFVNYKGNVDYNGNNVNITWVDANGKLTTAKSEFTNQYDGDKPNTVINNKYAIVLSKTPNAREIHGGSGDDTIYASQFNDKISYDGDGGTNRLVFGDDYPITRELGSNTMPGMVFDVDKGTITDTGTGGVATMQKFTQIVGTKGDDHFIIGDTAASYYFDGRDGNNVFDMQKVDATTGAITGSSGNNELFAGNGEDIYNLINSTGNNTIVDSGKNDSADKYNFDSSTGENKITDGGGSDVYHFDNITNHVDISDTGAGDDLYRFHNVVDSQVTIKDTNDGDTRGGNDVYDFATIKTDDNNATDFIKNTDVSILDENGTDKYQFDRTQGGSVTINDKGIISDKSTAQDEYYFNDVATKVDITDQDGADNYRFNNAVTSADNTISIADKGTASDTYIFNDTKSDGFAQDDASNITIKDSGGQDSYHFDRITSKVKIDDIGTGDNYYTFHQADKSDIAINSLNDGIYLNGNDNYDFSTLKANDDSATDFIKDTVVNIRDENGTDKYNFERTQGGSVTINDAGTINDKSTAHDEYNFAEAATTVNITDQGGEDFYRFNDVSSKVKIDDHGVGNDFYSFHEAKDSEINIHDYYDNRNVSQNLSDVYDFATATSTTNPSPTDHIENTVVNIIDESGSDSYYFDRTQGGSVTIDDQASYNALSNDQDTYYFNDSTSKIGIKDAAGTDVYNFNRIKVDADNTVSITDNGSGQDKYNFRDVKATGAVADGQYHIVINENGNGVGDTNVYDFTNFGDANSAAVTSASIDDKGGDSDRYLFHNANNANVKIHDYDPGTASDDIYDFSSSDSGATDHISNSTINITDDSGQDNYYFNRTQSSKVTIADNNSWQDKYYFYDTKDSDIAITDHGGISGKVGADIFNFDRTQGGSVKINEDFGTTNYNFNDIKTKVDISDRSGSDTYNFKNSITSKDNTITIKDVCDINDNAADTYNFVNTSAENMAEGDLYNINITDNSGADFYNFTNAKKTKVHIVDGYYGADTYTFYNSTDSVIKIEDKTTDGEGSASGNFYYFGTNASNAAKNNDVTIIDSGGSDVYAFQFSQGGNVNIQDNGNIGVFYSNDNYRFENSNLDSVKIEDSYNSDNYHFDSSTTKSVTIKDHGANYYIWDYDYYYFGDSKIDKVNIIDDDGRNVYDFTAANKDSSVVTIYDKNDSDKYNFSSSKGDITIIDGGSNAAGTQYIVVYDPSDGHMKFTRSGANYSVQYQSTSIGQLADEFNFQYSTAKVKIQDGIFANDGTGWSPDSGNSDGIYNFQYSSGDNTIVNKGGLDKYYLGGSTGKFTVKGGTGTDILYVGKGYLDYDGGTRTDGGKENDWISFQDILEGKDKNNNLVSNKVDPNERTEGIYVNLGAASKGYANRSDVQSYNSAGATLAEGSDKGHFTNVENVIGSKFSDLIYGNDQDNYFLATQGNDEYFGGAGSDTYYVGAPDIGGRIEGMFASDSDADIAQMAAWAAKPDLTFTRDRVTIDLDHGFATTLWKDSNNVQSRDTLHDFENAYGALFFKNTIIGRWGTEGKLVGGYQGDDIYSVANSAKDKTSYIDGNDTRVQSGLVDGAKPTDDTLRYDYVTDDGNFINGVYVKMDAKSSFTGTTVKGFTGFDGNGVAQGTQGNDVFKSIAKIMGSKGDDIFEGSEAGGHVFDGVSGLDRFISHGGTGSSYSNGYFLDYSKLDRNQFLDVYMNDDTTGSITRGGGAKDTLFNVKNIIGTSGDDVIHFNTNSNLPQSFLMGFDGGKGTDFMVKTQNISHTYDDQIFNIGGGFKNIQGFSFIDTHKDTINIDLDSFFKDFKDGTADADGSYHAKFFLNGDPSKDGKADIFNAIDKDGGWDWKVTSDDGHGNQTWSAFEGGAATGDTIEVTRGQQGDNHLQDSHPSIP